VPSPQPRRSCLSVPGSSEKMMLKALASAADEVVIDLEDAVTPAAKDAARDLVVRVLSTRQGDGPLLSVRVNGAGTPWSHADIIAVGSLPRPPHSIVLPKIESAGDVAYADRLLTGVRAAPQEAPVRLQALVESARGLVALREITGASPRLESLILGYADLAASLGRAPVGEHWGGAREQVLWAARAAGLLAIDGPWLSVADDAPFRAAVQVARETGFDAKWVIHPAQLETVNRAFAPSAAELDWARQVVAALDGCAAGGRGAVQVAGQMLDEALAARARAVLAQPRGAS